MPSDVTAGLGLISPVKPVAKLAVLEYFISNIFSFALESPFH